MTIYGEWNDQFRPRPKKSALALFSTAALLIALALSWTLYSVVQVASAESHTAERDFPLFAPLAQQSTVFRSAPHAGDGRDLIAPTAAVVFAVLLLTVVPTSSKASHRLGIHAAAMASMLYTWSRAFELSPATWLEGDLSISGLWRPVALVAGYALFDFAERRRNQLLGNFEKTDTPLQRLALWAVCTALPLTVIAIVSLLAGYGALLFSALVALAVTCFVNVARRPSQRFEELTEVEMREASFAAPILAVVISAVYIWAFGFPLFGQRTRAVLLGDKRPRFASLKEVEMATSAVTEGEVTPRPSSSQRPAAGTTAAEPKQVIDIRWSNPRKQAAEPRNR